MPTLKDAVDDYMAANPRRGESTNRSYRRHARLHLGDWMARPLDAITRRDVEARFNHISEERGMESANHVMSFLRSVYRRPCVDHDGLRNPVEQWLAGGGRFNTRKRRKISAPVEVLPRWARGHRGAGGESGGQGHLLVRALHRHAGRRDRASSLESGGTWKPVSSGSRKPRTGEPLELPTTRQLSEILARRLADREMTPPHLRCWVFPSARSKSGHVEAIEGYYARISLAGGAKFWFHALRNCFISVAERELLLPRTLTKRLVNHARPSDVTEGYAAD